MAVYDIADVEARVQSPSSALTFSAGWMVKSIQLKVKCTRCHALFYRYNYGYGRRRQYKPHRKVGHNTADKHGHPKLMDTCIFCHGQVEQI